MGGVIFWPLFLLAATPLALAAPAHADDNTVSISVDQNAALQPTGTLYKATANITVKTGKPYGFNLTMQADTADLVNTKDSTHKISATPSSTPVALNANRWGYAIDEQTNKFARVPARNDTSAVIVDTSVKGKQADCNCKDQCATSVTFAANIDPTSLATGTYSATVTYTATAKPAPKPPVVDPTVCKSGDPKSDCQVDLDPNMIPVIYTGNAYNDEWTSIKWPENPHDPGAWYNYNQKKWANAVTVRNPSKYKGERRVVDKDDILGFWVYIPRYAYEVMRRDVTDAPVPAQNFTIHFEKATDPKRYPAESKCAGRNMDYRTTCGLNRDYIKGQPSEQGTWATHPAFTFGKKELNGIWFAKFETTGSSQQPTILPNERHIEGYYSSYLFIGGFYTVAKSLGVNDPNNVGGNSVATTQNAHHLARFNSHMVNNNDWGAATYLSASKYGAGYNGVQINANVANYSNSSGTTGCGPQSNGDTSSYSDSGTLGTPQACGNADRAYNGTLGQLASTTNNVYGIYDMFGGGWEYVAAGYSDSLNNSNTNYFDLAAHPPYVNTYNITNLNSCTFNTCGGQALYETNNGNKMYFVNSSEPWFGRGGGYWDNGSIAGLFCTRDFSGLASGDAFRVALALTAQN